MRDLDTNPYSKDEQRVAEFLSGLGVGGGDDPIGFILASHALLAETRKELLAQKAEMRHALEHILDCDAGTKLCKDCLRLAKAAYQNIHWTEFRE